MGDPADDPAGDAVTLLADIPAPPHRAPLLLRFHPFTREELLSVVDQHGNFSDPLLEGFKLELNLYVKVLNPALKNKYNARLPLLITLFAVCDNGVIAFCGRRRFRFGKEEYCSCDAFETDTRRCRHLWATEFFIARRRGDFYGEVVESHRSLLTGVFYDELRIYHRPKWAPPGLYGDLPHSQPITDHQGFAIFVVLANSSVFMNKFDRLQSMSGLGEHRLYQALREFYTRIFNFRSVLDFNGLYDVMMKHHEIRSALGLLDPALLLAKAFVALDARMRYSTFSRLIFWQESVHRQCTQCATTLCLPHKDGYKNLAIPTARIVGDTTPELTYKGTSPSIIDILKHGGREYDHIHCATCRKTTPQVTERRPRARGKLVLIDVHQHPRFACTRAWNIPHRWNDWDGSHTQYELVGFLVNDIGEVKRGFSAVTLNNGALFEWLGTDVVPFEEHNRRIPTVLVYQRASRPRFRIDNCPKVTVNPVLFTPSPPSPIYTCGRTAPRHNPDDRDSTPTPPMMAGSPRTRRFSV